MSETVQNVFEGILNEGRETALAIIQESIETKGDGTPMTKYDPMIEHMFREAVSKTFPGDGVIGEELKEANQLKARMFTCDPIDGTRQFCNLGPLFGFLAGVHSWL